MDHFYTYHQTNHFEKIFLQLINSMVVVINQLLDQQSLSHKSTQEGEIEKTVEGDIVEGSTMFLWD
jgi:hypothetical protein